MKKIAMRELSKRAASVVKDLERSGEPVIVLRHDKAVAFMVPVDSAVGRDLILALAPDTAAILDAAERERLSGRAEAWERTR